MLTDVPRQFGDYSPQNFDHRFLGAIRLDEALQQSRNIPAVQVLNHVGPDTFLSWLAKAGISLRVTDANLAIALGGEGIRLTDLVTLFSALSRNGEVIYPRLSVDDPVQTARLLSPASELDYPNYITRYRSARSGESCLRQANCVENRDQLWIPGCLGNWR
ncbi:hypothetical protein P4S72_25800 [Vibrio sp. PP-XX7]